ncbi:MAG: hypothetical protein U0350_14195 [Caldilineaceae bacterium]
MQTDHQWLAAAAGTSVIARQVLLSGRYRAPPPYAYAVLLLLMLINEKFCLQAADR